ncbi:hypothetical protein M9H77_11710 [Catharanthus roseus]|uniref:Uncharacterized protein n=1 Tax=Catharanthus roseus TaxID=4058 RepID=A0ACC0BFD0_CATRO|nr:hypothetical protein M9H77_11710 [Catharanthus roseus]
MAYNIVKTIANDARMVQAAAYHSWQQEKWQTETNRARSKNYEKETKTEQKQQKWKPLAKRLPYHRLQGNLQSTIGAENGCANCSPIAFLVNLIVARLDYSKDTSCVQLARIKQGKKLEEKLAKSLKGATLLPTVALDLQSPVGFLMDKL